MRTTPDVVARLDQLAVVTRAAVLNRYRPDSCIESTRVAAEVCRYHGHRLVPVPTRAGFYTRDAYTSDSQSGWSVGVAGTGKVNVATGGWDGHLVGLVDDAWLFDLSADQFDRPDKGIDVPGPLVVPATRAQLDAGLVMADDESGLVVAYQTIESSAWRRTPAWTRDAGAVRAVAATAIRVLAELSVTT